VAASLQQPLVVEGLNDHHAILQLMRRAGVLDQSTTQKNSPIDFKVAGSKKRLLDEIVSRAKGSETTAVGFVIDADDKASEYHGVDPTWNAVKHRLTQLGVVANPRPLAGGFIGQVPKAGPKIGIWIMPDNQGDGALEEFLTPQIDPQNALFQFARAKTLEAGQLANVTGRFAPSDRSKAELHCWLAWSEEPGQPYGHAMRSGRFDVTREPAVRFCQWVRDLYGL
jgi:hypothetical protein